MGARLGQRLPHSARMFETPLRREHESQGANLGTFFGGILPVRFTDFFKEYSAARDAVALLDTNYHAYFIFEGPDRTRYLNAVLTNDIQSLAPGTGCAALLLNPQGHIQAELNCYALADRFLTISHYIVRERTAERLERFIIMDDVQFTDETDATASIALEGPKTATIVSQLCGISLESLPEYSIVEAELGNQPCRIVRRSNFGGVGAQFIVKRDSLVSLWQLLLNTTRAHGGGPVGCETLNSLRLEAGIPWFGYDFDDKVIPPEAALETTHISFTKGCYTGQEIIERVRSRGHVNRHLVRLEFSDQTPPETATKLEVSGKEVGHITSAGYSPALGRAIGMGYVRHESVSIGSQLDCAGMIANVVGQPYDFRRMSAGKPAQP